MIYLWRIKIMKLRHLFSLMLLSLAILATRAQNNIPTPNAASLGIFGQIPVSPFTGTPNINIPLYNLKDGDIEVPISLNYHTTLVKPEHRPGWVGLGWNLNYAGSITRIAKGTGYYDEFADYEDGTRSYYNNCKKLDGANWPTLLSRLPKDWLPDTEPDEFMFNFDGYSGKFFLNHKGEWVVQSQSPVQIEIEHTLGVDLNILFFLLATRIISV